MESLSSSFLQKPALNQSLTPNPPFPLIKFRISSVKIDEKCDTIQERKRINSHQTHIITTTRPRKLKATPKKSSTPAKEQESDQNKTTRRKNSSFLTKIFKVFDDFVCDFIDPDPLPSFIDPKHVLAGNFAPVDELPPTACPAVEGSLPPSLNGGAYIRNGPNPQFFPRGPYHLFDGDGMLHATTISDGKATFCSRFIKTYKYNLERESGSPVILNVFSAFNGPFSSLARCAIMVLRVLAGEYDARHGVGGANTSLALFAGKLFALSESDLPYRVKLNSDGDVITLGRHDSFGEAFMTMTAHPKIDSQSGDAFAFRHSVRPPFLSYFRIKEGIKQPEVPIFSLKHCSLIHDFAITKNYAIFPDTQILIKPKEILRGQPPVRVDPAKKQRLGIIPRYAVDDEEMWWVEVAGLNMVHTTNAWEEDGGETVVVVGSNVSAMEHFLEKVDLCRPLLERIEINVKTKSVRSRRLLSEQYCLDFAVINPAYVGNKNRYVYAAVGAPMPKIAGVVKIDLSLATTSSGDCTVASHLYPPGIYGGEPFFVAKEPDNPAAEEDDGYLVTYVHDENIDESKFLVMDAKSPNLEIVAAVKLPQRVPYGFHGIFVPESELKNL